MIRAIYFRQIFLVFYVFMTWYTSAFVVQSHFQKIASELPFKSYVGALFASPKKIRNKARKFSNSHGNAGNEESMMGEMTMEKNKVINTNEVSNTRNGSSNDLFMCKQMHPLTRKALVEVFKFNDLTEIQDLALNVESTRDIVGQAITGTGKTIAFLIPAIETVLAKNDRFGAKVEVLILSPTRELALQIADDAEKLMTFHKDLSVQVMIGGTSINRDRALLSRRIPTLLVVTPGRLIEHLEETKISGGKKFSEIVSKIGVLIFDEADRLLEMGFRNDIMKMLSYVTKKRRTFLFSATMPPKLTPLLKDLVKSDYEKISTIVSNDKENIRMSTNTKIEQYVLTLSSLERIVPNVLSIIHEHVMSFENGKVIVFFATARMVGYFANVYKAVYGKDDISVLQIHSKKSQGHRKRVAEAFRDAKRNAVLFSSDVSSRGMDYPDVTSVIQIGAPENKESYVHRLGRTGRINKSGKGVLVLLPFEQRFLRYLDNIQPYRFSQHDNSALGDHLYDKLFSQIRSGDASHTKSAEMAYQSFLGYYLALCRRKSQRFIFLNEKDIVQLGNCFALELGLKEVPILEAEVVSKMGLIGVNGIRCESDA
mmetsp:Transcript_20628/g.26681  ORF Transcript_20628/g.26681 Transcript_20628/m.26681 type:complete len:597 (-) Transcript_20628:361-2151(-)